MRLTDLTADLQVLETNGDAGIEVSGICYDSREAGPGCLFICVPGGESDGHDFAQAAVDAGASALVVERGLGLGVTEVLVEDARQAMAPLAAAFYGFPTKELQVAGVTGTNGKTTTVFLLSQILEYSGRQTGMIGTVSQVIGGEEREAGRTTPEAIDLQAAFRQMLEGGDVACVMEVSSHALSLARCDAIDFSLAVFTNLSQDHLDFHGGMEEYFAAKRLLFESGPQHSVVNIDDAYGQRLAADFDAITFSASAGDADYSARDIHFDLGGARFVVDSPAGELQVRNRLPGRFNVANSLAALAGAVCLGVDPAVAVEGLGRAVPVPGRLEPVEEGQEFGVLVDYAHTPDSVASVLDAARELTEGKVIAVLGAGGDRDRSKRPLMGRAGEDGSDLLVITSDNPRSEDPGMIIEEIVAGLGDPDSAVVEPDREAAIDAALGMAEPGDIVVIAGKGHEQGQEFENGRKIPFDDREVARRHLRGQLGATG